MSQEDKPVEKSKPTQGKTPKPDNSHRSEHGKRRVTYQKARYLTMKGDNQYENTPRKTTTQTLATTPELTPQEQEYTPMQNKPELQKTK